MQKGRLGTMDRSALRGSHRKLLEGDETSRNEDYHELSIFNKGIRSNPNLKDAGPYSDVGVSARMWNSTWLHSMVLIGFAIVFAVMFITLIILYHFSETHHGLETQASRNHYSWTYGPTACKHVQLMSSLLPLTSYIVLVIIISLWRQVDYRCKALAPWQEMRRGPASAKNSLLLDYVSPMFPISLFASIRNGHWAVIGSSLGFILLKLTVSHLVILRRWIG